MSSFIVTTAELLRRTYYVTTSGDEARAAELAEQGDYGVRAEETVELAEFEDEVCDFSIIEIEPATKGAAEGARP